MWNFKEYLWNSSQNKFPIHWKVWFLYNVGVLRAFRFNSSYLCLKRTQISRNLTAVINELRIVLKFYNWPNGKLVKYLWPLGFTKSGAKTPSIVLRIEAAQNTSRNINHWGGVDSLALRDFVFSLNFFIFIHISWFLFWALALKFTSCECHRNSLVISQHWFR